MPDGRWPSLVRCLVVLLAGVAVGAWPGTAPGQGEAPSTASPGRSDLPERETITARLSDAKNSTSLGDAQQPTIELYQRALAQWDLLDSWTAKAEKLEEGIRGANQAEDRTRSRLAELRAEMATPIPPGAELPDSP